MLCVCDDGPSSCRHRVTRVLSATPPTHAQTQTQPKKTTHRLKNNKIGPARHGQDDERARARAPAARRLLPRRRLRVERERRPRHRRRAQQDKDVCAEKGDAAAGAPQGRHPRRGRQVICVVLVFCLVLLSAVCRARCVLKPPPPPPTTTAKQHPKPHTPPTNNPPTTTTTTPHPLLRRKA